MSDAMPPASECLLLGIDTSGSEGSLAIGRMSADGNVTLVEQALLNGRHYADQVVPQLKELFVQAGVALKDFSVIVVVNGPGSFTGLRAGIGAAKALAEVGELPLIAISRLALLAAPNENHVESDDIAGGLNKDRHAPSALKRVTGAVLDAGRGEYYIRWPCGTESVGSLVEVAEAAGSTPIRACETKVMEQLADLQVELVLPPTAYDAILLAAPRILARNYDDRATVDANYVRRPYANFAGPV